MRIVNEKFQTISEGTVDLSKGVLVPSRVIKETAMPIDNINKFAWAEDDWEDVQMYVINPLEPQPSPLERLEAQVAYTAMMTNTLMEGNK